MAVRKTLIRIDPVERLYHHKQLISFPGVDEILFLFLHAQKDHQAPDAADTQAAAPTSKHTSAGK